MWVSVVTAALGIISTLIAYFLNPQRRKDKLRSQLIDVFIRLEKLGRDRDEALQKNDSDTLTVVNATIIKLCQDKADLLQQLRQN